ncbi:hypothetical protein FB45DRAFT_237052 [Roridomyces roridus]|uniref:Uncharacterized protein n=1 Tax=Roridomyces roridus TaxID=1738132 RepID=A0AAD7FEZ7_9AGAR|nr:hypothetical protein FB45DRAFT_237052 [Roridomyces roridus]
MTSGRAEAGFFGASRTRPQIGAGFVRCLSCWRRRRSWGWYGSRCLSGKGGQTEARQSLGFAQIRRGVRPLNGVWKGRRLRRSRMPALQCTLGWVFSSFRCCCGECRGPRVAGGGGEGGDGFRGDECPAYQSCRHWEAQASEKRCLHLHTARPITPKPAPVDVPLQPASPPDSWRCEREYVYCPRLLPPHAHCFSHSGRVTIRVFTAFQCFPYLAYLVGVLLLPFSGCISCAVDLASGLESTSA